MDVQVIKAEGGGELVVLSRRDFDMLMARAGDPDAEQRAAEILVAEARAAGTQLVPAWLSDAVLQGLHPVRAARLHKGLTQTELATAAGVRQGHISDVESGRRGLGRKALIAIARALDVEPDWIAD